MGICLRVGLPFWLIHKMATLLFIIPPFFSLIMMRVGAEDQKLGQSIDLFNCFLQAGGVVWGRILRLLWCPGWGLHSSFQGSFGEVGIPGSTTG
jgi:hypothetical protein